MKKDFHLYHESFEESFLLKHKISFEAEKRAPHIHDVFEILLIRSENVICDIGEKTYFVAPNTAILFNNMDLHLIKLKERCRYDRYVLYFKPEYIEDLSSPSTDLLECFFFRPFPNPQVLELDEDQAAKLVSMMERIIDGLAADESESYGEELNRKFLIGELLIYVNRLYRKHHSIQQASILEEYKRACAAITYIYAHMDSKLSLDVLSKHACTNKHTLCECFKQVTGVSPNQYIINCRINKAKELLASNIPVDSVCSLVGYNNLSHFSRAFKQHSGISPKQYAIQNRIKSDV